jgi:hypothetical protein
MIPDTVVYEEGRSMDQLGCIVRSSLGCAMQKHNQRIYITGIVLQRIENSVVEDLSVSAKFLFLVLAEILGTRPDQTNRPEEKAADDLHAE